MSLLLEKLAAFFAGPIGRWIVVAALVSAALFAGGVYERDIGYREGLDVGAKQLEAQAKENAKAVMALDAKYRNEEAAHKADTERLETQYAIDLADEKQRSEDDVAAARAGSLVLRVPRSICADNGRVSNAPANPTSVTEAGTAELPRALTANLQRLAHDANEVALTLNLCEDQLVSDRAQLGARQ